jgi:hypothetical protein
MTIKNDKSESTTVNEAPAKRETLSLRRETVRHMGVRTSLQAGLCVGDSVICRHRSTCGLTIQ